MPIPDNVSELFYAGTRTDAVRFVINDSVRIKSGSSSGRIGAVVSIVSLEPETTFLVEPGAEPHGDLCVSQSDLELME